MENPIDQLKTSLKASKWSDDSQKRILAVLPRLGKNNIEFLQNKVEGFETRLEAKYIATVLEQEVFLLEKMLGSDTKEFISMLEAAPESPSYDFGQYVLPFVLDIAWAMRQHKIPESQDLVEVVIDFEINFFSQLPFEEVVLLVQEDVVTLAKKSSMLLLLKQYYWNKFRGYKKSFSGDMLAALEGNEEILGSNNLVMEEKKYPSTVHNWIQDYIQALPRSISARSTFDEIQYIRTSKNVALLSEEDKAFLLEIVKLHNWFLSPVVNEKEIRRYEAEQEMAREKEFLSQQPVVAPSYIEETPVRPVIDIDRKLQELKKKTGVRN